MTTTLPQTILSVELPDIKRFSVSEVSRSLLLVEAIANYDIKSCSWIRARL